MNKFITILMFQHGALKLHALLSYGLNTPLHIPLSETTGHYLKWLLFSLTVASLCTSTIHTVPSTSKLTWQKENRICLQMYTNASGSIYVNSCTQYLHVYNISGANPCKRVHPSAGNAFTQNKTRCLDLTWTRMVLYGLVWNVILLRCEMLM